MYLTVTFGFEGPTRQVFWNSALEQFPRYFKYGGKRWEWVAYDKDLTGKSDYALLFGELPTYDPNFYIEMDDFEYKFFSNGNDNECTCGAKYTSFSWDHMRYCSKYSKWK